MILVSSASNSGSDTEFILMGMSFLYIMHNRGPRIDAWGNPISMYPSWRKNLELH